MKKSFDDYTLLAGSHGARGSLWLGKEHLLVIEGRGWVLPISEVYRRVDYANIQALGITPTSGYVWIAIATGLGAGLFGLFTALAWGEEPFLPISLGLPAGLLLVLFVLHLLRGPTCACTLQTAVQVLKLRPLGRMRAAVPAMEQLEALCREHQGAMPEAQALAGSVATPLPPMAAPMAGVKPPWAGSKWVLGAGAGALVWGMLLAGELFVDGMPYTLLELGVGVTAFLLGVLAIVRALRMQVPGPLGVALWGFPFASFLAAIGLYAGAIAGVVKHSLEEAVTRGRNAPNVDQLLIELANLRFSETEGWGIGLVGIGVLIGIAGLVMLSYGRSSGPAAVARETPPPPPASASSPPPLSPASPLLPPTPPLPAAPAETLQ